MACFLSPVPWVAAAVSFVTCPLLARLAPRLGLMDEPDSGRKRHGHAVPLIGGIAVALASFTSLPWVDSRLWSAWALVGAMGLVGLTDDLLGLRPMSKLVLQFALPLLALVIVLQQDGCLGMLMRPGVFAVFGGWLLCVVLLTNAFNFTDNSNGQCAGLAIVSLGAEGVVLWMRGSDGSATFLLAFAAAFLGFLPWNYPGARAFLGDCGSHVAGAVTAVGLWIVWNSNGASSWNPVLPCGMALIVFVPLLDFTVAVGGRLRRGQAPWKGDLTHLYHRLVARGWKPAAAVALLWLAALVTSAAGVLVLTWRR